MHLFLLHVLLFSIFSETYFWPQYMYLKMSPNNGFRWCPLGKLSHLGLERLSSIKATAITSNSLSPTGRFKIRIDDNYEHLSDYNCKKNSSCGLHRWLGIKTQKQVMYCNACNVNLCVQYYKLFHKAVDIVGNKNSPMKKYDNWIVNIVIVMRVCSG